MLLGSRNGLIAEARKEEQMYKELFLGLLRKTLTEVDIAEEINASTASGSRPFFGQSNITKLRLRNYITSTVGQAYYFGSIANLKELYLDNTSILDNSFVNLQKVEYVYMPAATAIYNPIVNKTVAGVFDFGNSRTCQQLLDSWSSLFKSSPSTLWAFRCSDGDVVWSDNDNAWVKSTNSSQNAG